MMRYLALVLALITGSASANASAATLSVQVNASTIKPLSLTRVQDLDLGSITLKPGTWSGVTVGISKAGVFTCTDPNLTCVGPTQPAIYNVQGQNKQVVQITASNVTLTNQSSSGSTLTLVMDAPATVTLTSSGIPGNDFTLGGSITLNSSTADGTYSGNLNVTVDY